MSATLPARMTADDFIVWAMEQPEGAHYELDDGEVIAMAPERARHSEVKGLLASAAIVAIRQAKLDCVVFNDGMAVRVDAFTLFEPDIMIRCGTRVPGDAVVVTDPVAIIEVLSPSTRYRDENTKLVGYLRLASLRHYVIVNAVTRAIIHHARDATGEIRTRIIANGRLELDPPGIVLEDFFPPADDVRTP